MGNNLSKNMFDHDSFQQNYKINPNFNKYQLNKNMKLKSGAMQGEFGEKKFIKP